MTEQKIVAVLGGQKSLGRQVKGAFDIDRLIRRGFHIGTGNHIKEALDLTDHELAGILDVSERTLSRIRKENKQLSPLASDRLYRIARIYALACEVLEDDMMAKKWLHRPQAGLGGEIPLDLLHTEAGTREVEDLLQRIEHGILS